jgi:hypothetical protein
MCKVESINAITLHLKFENCSYKLFTFFFCIGEERWNSLSSQEDEYLLTSGGSVTFIINYGGLVSNQTKLRWWVVSTHASHLGGLRLKSQAGVGLSGRFIEVFHNPSCQILGQCFKPTTNVSSPAPIHHPESLFHSKMCDTQIEQCAT